MRIRQNNIIKLLTCGLLLLGLTACSDTQIEDLNNGPLYSKSHLTLTFITPNDGTSTRSAAEDPDGYEDGIEYESTVNIEEGDYKIYFFTYTSGDTNGGTLITEFSPESVISSSTNTSTIYTMSGNVPEALMSESNFRVVMLANWGGYPSVTVGETTIDDLCEGDSATYMASSKFTLSENALIPFYGVQEYTNIEFVDNTTTTLSTPVSLLRAIAKVEVILTASSDVDAFDNVSIVNYNAQGYCAPWQVYTASDYDTNASKNPQTTDWPDEWVEDLHLVGNANDEESKTEPFIRVSSSDERDTWRIYVPEYNNMGDDYSYISVTINEVQYQIYFAEYTNGRTDNTDTTNRYSLKRNNLYRFYVSVNNFYLYVDVDVLPWVERLDNVEF